ncbi:hypothetical protein KEU06_10505 [Pseudaminobacter sp. 19-2017]|uniref:Uncharacterized protein n=1 Tax=Pseudaminobacter soli (ex Zhang et al. 2022) TaxID=2831468 RepID=A0A942I2X1_9HYPH|nr:hypothetical protein [Pseudaminobacter soli]MBS3649039.1 hypothetical protein [Pseudaminobacter soli]
MKITVQRESKRDRSVSAEATVVPNSQRDGYDLIWKKKGNTFRIDLDSALMERSRLEKERKKSKQAKIDRLFDAMKESMCAQGL